jgi:hypothetical protein
VLTSPPVMVEAEEVVAADVGATLVDPPPHTQHASVAGMLSALNLFSHREHEPVLAQGA